jgi:hypothetical protein
MRAGRVLMTSALPLALSLTLAFAMIASACTSDPRASLASLPPSTPSGNAASTTNPGLRTLAVWSGRVRGHIASYLATIDCARCEAKGTYHITEAQGTTTEATPVGSTPPLRDPDQWSFTTVLTVAASAKGRVSIDTGANNGTIRVTVDVDPKRAGDEFTYTVAGVSVT